MPFAVSNGDSAIFSPLALYIREKMPGIKRACLVCIHLKYSKLRHPSHRFHLARELGQEVIRPASRQATVGYSYDDVRALTVGPSPTTSPLPGSPAKATGW